MTRPSTSSAVLAIAILACTSEPGPTDISDAPSLAESSAALYTVRYLGDLGGNRSWAHAINAQGQVAGGSLLANGQTHAFRWQNGVMKDLGTLGGGYSNAFGINDHGHVVGVSRTASGADHAFVWKNGAMRDLGTIGSRSSAALDINNRGDIGGGADGIAIVWKRGVLTRLRYPRDATHCAVAKINADAVAVGQCTVRGTARAILWDGDRVRDLGTLGGSLSSPTDINRWGVVVGVSRLPSDTAIHAFLWEDGRMIDLVTRGAPRQLIANAINDHRQVVGSYSPGDFLHAIVWRKGQVTELSVPGVDNYAWDINLEGQAVGTTVTGNDSRAVLWTTE